MTQKKKSSILFSLLLLFIILVVFPLISLKYLKKGLSYRKDHLSTLVDLGSLKEFSAINIEGKSMSKDIALGKVTIISHESMACQQEHSTTLREYVEKFIKQDDFRFVIIREDDCISWDEAYMAESNTNQNLFAQMNSLISKEDLRSNVLLADRNGQLRGVYNLTERADIESLVTHTTLLLPPLKKR